MTWRVAARIATALAAVSVGQVAEGQSSRLDGPITARTYDAAFVRTSLRRSPDDPDAVVRSDSLRERIRRLSNGELVLSFVDDPAKHADPKTPLPSTLELARAAALAGGADLEAANAIQAAGGGAMSREAALIFGVADFVIARTKTELALAAIREGRQWFKDVEELRTLFPASNQFVVDTQVPVDDQTVSVLRVTVRRDLQAMPTSMWRLATQRCTAIDGCASVKNQAMLDAMRASALLAEAAVRRQSPLPALVALKAQARSEFRTVAGQVSAAGISIIAGEIVTGTGRRFGEALRTPSHADYAGALFARELNEVVAAGIDGKRAADGARSISEAAFAVQELSEEFSAVRDARDAPAAIRRERYAAVARGFAVAMDQVGRSVLVLAPGASGVEYLNVVGSVGDVVGALVEEDYVAAVSLSVASARVAGARLDPRFVRWASFGGALASARNPSEVTVALEQFALPPASYAVKRYPERGDTRRMAIHVNAYLGGSGGRERLSEDEQGVRRGGNYLGFTLPIGLELSFGANRHSVFVPMVDLGAVASYRLSDDSSEVAPNVRLANVVAPGLFYTLSVSRRLPVAVGAGWQYAPRLRSTKAGEVRNASRLGVFFASDIPLFRLR